MPPPIISFPTTLDWYIKKVFKLQKTIAKYVRPISNRIMDIPVPGDNYFDAVERLFERLSGVEELLTDPKITTVRLAWAKNGSHQYLPVNPSFFAGT